MSDMDLFLEQEGEAPRRESPGEGAMILSRLRFHELQILRKAVKRVFLMHYPVEFFTDREADRMIEALAPSVAERMIRAVVDKNLVRRDGSIAHGRIRLDE